MLAYINKSITDKCLQEKGTKADEVLLWFFIWCHWRFTHKSFLEWIFSSVPLGYWDHWKSKGLLGLAGNDFGFTIWITVNKGFSMCKFWVGCQNKFDFSFIKHNLNWSSKPPTGINSCAFFNIIKLLFFSFLSFQKLLKLLHSFEAFTPWPVYNNRRYTSSNINLRIELHVCVFIVLPVLAYECSWSW